MQKIDLTNKKFTRLRVIKEAGRNRHGGILWQCKCVCGKTSLVEGNRLKSGKTRSCGCLHTELLKKNGKKYARIHGGSYTRLYSIYSGMKQRCLNKNHQAYHCYGGRGITICEEWLKDFIQFEKWAKTHGYKKGLTLDRIDNEISVNTYTKLEERTSNTSGLSQYYARQWVNSK